MFVELKGHGFKGVAITNFIGERNDDFETCGVFNMQGEWSSDVSNASFALKSFSICREPKIYFAYKRKVRKIARMRVNKQNNINWPLHCGVKT